MALFFYNWLLRIFFPLLVFHYIRGRIVHKKYSRPVRERFGFFRIKLNPQASSRILIHAVSAGETVAAQPMVKVLRREFPEAEIVFSNVTETGYRRAKEIIEADHFVFFPLDYRFSVERFLNIIKPSHVFILETELWPNFLAECQNRNIPLAFINARISSHSFEKYSVFRPLFSPLIRTSLFYVQSQLDRERVESLGGQKVEIAGNLKVDQLAQNLSSPARERICAAFEDFERPIILFGSTHQIETKNCLDLIYSWQKEDFEASFIIAPRHLQFMDDYLKYAHNLSLSVIRKSAHRPPQDFEIMLVDTFGELANLYEICTIAVIGGSFEPIGGHSILEPALFGKPIIHGPHMENGKDLVSTFEMAGASWKAQDFAELKSKVELLVENPTLRLEIGHNAGLTLEKISGVAVSIFKDLTVKGFFQESTGNESLENGL